MALALLLGGFTILLFLGVPVGTAMLFASIIDVVIMGFPPVIVAERMLSSINSFPLLAVPFFILAGAIMNRGGLTARLVAVASAFVGHFRGGTAQVSVLASMFLSGISGSATADAAAIGQMLIPTMKKEGYSPGFACGVVAAAATMGPIIPPSIVMVIYGSMTNLSIGALFLAGIVPGVMIGISIMVIIGFMARKHNYPRHERMPWRQRLCVIWRGVPSLMAPVIILGGIFTGVYTATEAGVIACIYGLAVGLFVHRDLRLRDLGPVLVEAVETTAIPMYILASATLFGWLMTVHGMGNMLDGILTGVTDSGIVLMLMLVAIFLVIGILIEGLAALVIFVPVLMPLIPDYGLDPIHFSMVIIIVMLIGSVTPPVGLQIFIAASIGKTPVHQLIVWPFVWAMMAVVVLLIFIPGLVTWIPYLIMR